MDADQNHRVETIARQPLENVEGFLMDAIQRHLGCRADTLVAIPRYADTIVYAVQVADTSLIFKAADPRGQDPSRIALEAWACAQASGAGAPAPHILALDTTATLFPAPYLLMVTTPGQPLDSLGLSIEQQRPYLQQAGRFLRLVHTIAPDGYGSLDDEVYLRTGQIRGEFDTWRAAIVQGVEDALAYIEHRHLLDDTAISAIRRLMHEYDAVLTQRTASSLLHGDLGANHVYVDPARQCVTGLIDFGSRWAGDPVWDLATYEWDGGHPLEYLLEGYELDHAGEAAFKVTFAFYCLCQAVPWAVWCHKRGYTHAIAALARIIEVTRERLRQT
jgi:aminoglycoside phosphotransferase (APT) family kinase protein